VDVVAAYVAATSQEVEVPDVEEPPHPDTEWESAAADEVIKRAHDEAERIRAKADRAAADLRVHDPGDPPAPAAAEVAAADEGEHWSWEKDRVEDANIAARTETRSRYERQSAKLPRTGSGTSVLQSMQGFRKKLRELEPDDDDD
jgi:hypothetical protein